MEANLTRDEFPSTFGLMISRIYFVIIKLLYLNILRDIP